MLPISSSTEDQHLLPAVHHYLGVVGSAFVKTPHEPPLVAFAAGSHPLLATTMSHVEWFAMAYAIWLYIWQTTYMFESMAYPQNSENCMEWDALGCRSSKIEWREENLGG